MGNRYIIELEDEPFIGKDGEELYRVKGFNSLVFDKIGIDKLHPLYGLEEVQNKYYEKGTCDAWNLAKDIYRTYDRAELLAVSKMSFSEAKEDFNQNWSKLRVGDEVIGTEGVPYIVMSIYTSELETGKLCQGFGKGGVYHLDRVQNCKRTGRHFFGVDDLLKAIEGQEEQH